MFVFQLCDQSQMEKMSLALLTSYALLTTGLSYLIVEQESSVVGGTISSQVCMYKACAYLFRLMLVDSHRHSSLHAMVPLSLGVLGQP
jgi:hypothetical protein